MAFGKPLNHLQIKSIFIRLLDRRPASKLNGKLITHWVVIHAPMAHIFVKLFVIGRWLKTSLIEQQFDTFSEVKSAPLVFGALFKSTQQSLFFVFRCILPI